MDNTNSGSEQKKRIFGDGFLHQEWTPDSHCDGVENRE
jgi:hypothetical protein